MSDDNTAKPCAVCERDAAKTRRLVEEIFRDLQMHLGRGVLEGEPLWHAAAWLGHAILNDHSRAERIADFVETRLPQLVGAFVLAESMKEAEQEGDGTLH